MIRRETSHHRQKTRLGEPMLSIRLRDRLSVWPELAGGDRRLPCNSSNPTPVGDRILERKP